ncbi:biotin/lipoyl-binding protein [Rhodopirellula sp. P2]|uniref:biotin/lipoyl-binding protein n=1 Tax=Rhodopirellula sp. P2 TaxID=2127060 RepID=UPI00236761D8|nr:biotin/lipoyl-binding protein [Rhodopirellula sp. P2]WDQ15595.1 biotin/lipoyl-binding protein [Rhodopirellula sp. P2]
MNTGVTSSTQRPLGVHHKVGLKAVRVSHRHSGWVVVHDAIAGKYHRLREDEYFLLTLLDGQCSLDELRDHYQDRYPNRRVRSNQINALLFRFHESGLTTSLAAMQGDPLLERADTDRRQKRWALASQWLFMRFPGIDPAPVMRVLMPIVRPLLTPLGLFAMIALVVSAAVMMLVHRTRYLAELPASHEWLTMQNALILAGVIAATKIAHELGHAVVSERFGAKCRSIGPMLLVFTPALYCDTSGSWMIPSRLRRAAVAMAGIATEIVIASIAAWVWLRTPAGLTHTIASHVMVVCGISTIVFNANPLLRYDGYYLLSDMTDMPNLAQRAQRRWGRFLAKVFLGVPSSELNESADQSVWLLVYAVASLAYRWILMATIIGFIWISLRPYGLEIIGQLLALFAAASMLWAGLVPLRRFWKNPVNRRKMRPRRALVWCVLLIAIGYAGTIPLPRHVHSAVRFFPEHEVRVHLTSPGVLSQLHVEPGQWVSRGDVLAELTNPEIELEVLDAESDVAEQTMRLEGLRASQTLVPEASSQLPAAEALLGEMTDRFTAAKRRRESLTITAPCDGMVMVAQNNPQSASESSLDADANPLDVGPGFNPAVDRTAVRLASWSGSPTAKENSGCSLEAGTELLSIAASDESAESLESSGPTPIRWRAEAVIQSIQRQRITLGGPAWMIRDSSPTQILRGRVIRISEETYDPRMDAPRRDHQRADQATRTPETSYVVAVSIEDRDTAPSNCVAGASGRVKFAVSSASCWQRIREFFSSSFRFR